MKLKSYVILSEAKNLCVMLILSQILRFAQDDTLKRLAQDALHTTLTYHFSAEWHPTPCLDFLVPRASRLQKIPLAPASCREAACGGVPPASEKALKKLASETARNTDLSELVREVHGVDKRASE